MKEICKVKVCDNIPPHYFCLWNISKDFPIKETDEISLNSALHDFSTDYSLIDKKIFLVLIL